MSALAKVLLTRGESVCGSDRVEGSDLDPIRRMGGEVRVGHAAENLNHPDRVVYSSSIWPDNPELVAARNRAISVLHRGQMLARLVSQKRTIAVTGAHGKSTTTGMMALALVRAGLDPMVALGAELEEIGGNARFGKGLFAVVEADESDGSFLWFSPMVAVITNMDEEHLDFFRNPGEILECYASFIERIPAGGTLVGCVDDPNVRRLFSAVDRRKIGYGLSEAALRHGSGQDSLTADRIQVGAGQSRFRVLREEKPLGSVRLQIPGVHNVVNSLAVVAVAQVLGIDFRTTAQALESYRGARRRFQIQAQEEGILVVEDYAHHPTEIEATLQAARGWPDRRIRCLFQPHRYSRTRFLLRRFASCFALADEVILLPIYAASEDPIDGVSSETLAAAIRAAGKENVRVESPERALERLAADARPGDLILFLGAGSVGQLARRWNEVRRRENASQRSSV